MRSLLTGMLLLSFAARADTIVLRNNSGYVGHIVSENPSEVTFSSGGVEWTFKREQIASLKRDAKGAKREAAQPRKTAARATADDKARKEHETKAHDKSVAENAQHRSSGPAPSAPGSTDSSMQRLQQLVHQPAPSDGPMEPVMPGGI